MPGVCPLGVKLEHRAPHHLLSFCVMLVFFTFPFASPSSRWAGLSRDCVPPYTKPGRSSRWHGFDCTQERASRDHDRRRVRFGGASAHKLIKGSKVAIIGRALLTVVMLRHARPPSFLVERRQSEM